MDLADVALFRTIAARGSLSAAARQTRTTPMAVSRRLAGLEAEMGVRLFHRTTRSLALTPEGEAFLPYAVTLLETHDAALASVAAGDAGLTGVLKVTAPNVIGHSVVVPVVAALIADNPELRVDLVLNDSLVDIAAAGLDVAIRVSSMEPSDLIATRLADNPRILCASAAYLARFGRPETIADLVSHPCIRLHAVDSWPFRIDGKQERVRIDGPLSANTVDAVRAACLAGMGIAMMTYWDVRDAIAVEALEPIVLTGAEPDTLGIWAVFPTRKHLPPRVRQFIALLRERLLPSSPG